MPELNEMWVHLLESSPVLAILLLAVKYLTDSNKQLQDRLAKDEKRRKEDSDIHNKQNQLLEKLLLRVEELSDKTNVVDKVKEMLRDERK